MEVIIHPNHHLTIVCVVQAIQQGLHDFSRRCGVFALGQLCAEKGGKLGEQKAKSLMVGCKKPSFDVHEVHLV